jgi:predicted helicase
VFDIQVGTAITIAIADGSRQGQGAEVFYLDSWAEGCFARSAKLAWLARGAGDGRLANAVQVARGALEDFRPRPFGNGEWPSVRECFKFGNSGIQTKRDSLVYGVTEAAIMAQLNAFVAAPLDMAKQLFHEVGARTVEAARRHAIDPRQLHRVGYRPLDNRLHYNHNAFNDRLRPELQQVWRCTFCQVAPEPGPRLGATGTYRITTPSAAAMAATPFRCTTAGRK